jgi:hypothetical protein
VESGKKSRKKSEDEVDESINCKCGSRLDNKGLMLCCEICEKWSHAACYKIKKSDVPEAFFCAECKPPVTQLVFDDVADVQLRAMLEQDRDAFGFKPGMQRKRLKPGNEVIFKQEERPILEKYWKIFARASEDDRGCLAEQIGRLFCLSGDLMEAHFVLIGEDVLDGALCKTLPAKQAPPGRAPPGRRNTLTKSVVGARTTRAELPPPCAPEKQCNSDGSRCGETDHCHCRTNKQECVAETEGASCAQCGCALSCTNCCLSTGASGAPYACVPFEFGWRFLCVDVVKPHGFVCEVVGKVCDENSALKGSWTNPLRHDCRELFVRDLGLMWDQEKYGNDARFIRRSCNPNCDVKWVWVGKELRLGIWARDNGLQAGQEATIAWDRPWDTLTSHVQCACDGRGVCAVLQWYGEREHLANSLPVVPERIGTRRAEQQRPTKLQAELETTLNPLTTPDNKLSREERKLQQVLKTIEKLEKHDKLQPKAEGESSTPNKKRSRASALAETTAEQPQQRHDQDTQKQPQHQQEQQNEKSQTSECQNEQTSSGRVAGSSVVVPAPVAESATAVMSASSMTHVSTPQSASKGFGGKKAWMLKFSDGDGSHAPAAVPAVPEVIPDMTSPPSYGWKKRAMLDAPEPFLLESLERPDKKSKDEGNQ